MVDAIEEIKGKGSGRGPVPMPIELYFPKPAAPAAGEAAAPAAPAAPRPVGDSLGLDGARGAFKDALETYPVDGNAAIDAALMKIAAAGSDPLLGLGVAAKLDQMKRELEEFKAWERLMFSVPPKLWAKLSAMIMAMLETAGPGEAALQAMEAKCATLLREEFNKLPPEEKASMLSGVSEIGGS